MDCFIEARSIAELNRKKLSAMKPGDLGGAGAEARMGGGLPRSFNQHMSLILTAKYQSINGMIKLTKLFMY